MSSNCSPGHVECSFVNPAYFCFPKLGNILLKSRKQIGKLFIKKIDFLKMFFGKQRMKFLYPCEKTLAKIPNFFWDKMRKNCILTNFSSKVSSKSCSEHVQEDLNFYQKKFTVCSGLDLLRFVLNVCSISNEG